MTRNGNSVRTLVIGNSHTYYAIKPDAIGDSVFNIANVSQNPEYDYFLLTKFETRLTNLNNLIVIVDEDNIFEPPIEENKEWFRAIYYKIYYGCDKHGNFSKYNFEISNFPRFTLKIQKLFNSFFTNSSSHDCDSLGWGCIFTAPERFDFTEMHNKAISTEKSHRCKNWANVDYNMQYLNKIGDWCKSHNVNIIVITTPMWSDYVEMISSKQLTVMYDVINQFTRKYNAIYKDYLCDPRFTGRDFRDPDHLSDLGAEKFSLIIKQDFPKL